MADVRFGTRAVITVAGLALVLAARPGGARAGDSGNPNPGVVPPNARPHGQTYGEWSAGWWRWAYSMPADRSPLTDTADCSTGQSGRVWFLGGTFSTNPVGGDPQNLVGRARRTCTIPPGTFLFVSILNAEASALEGNGTTEAELSKAAKYLEAHAVSMEAAVDGVPVNGLGRYRVQSPLFTFGPLPPNNLLRLPAGSTSPSVADGVFLMLNPLPPGRHTIHWGGVFRFTQAEDGFEFTLTLDIDYTITVAHGR